MMCDQAHLHTFLLAFMVQTLKVLFQVPFKKSRIQSADLQVPPSSEREREAIAVKTSVKVSFLPLLFRPDFFQLWHSLDKVLTGGLGSEGLLWFEVCLFASWYFCELKSSSAESTILVRNILIPSGLISVL